MTKKPSALILLIDDEPDLRKTSRLILETEFKVIEADSGETGLQLFASKPVDCVVCDIRMPGIDGLQTLERIKYISPTTEVIMHTAVIDTASAVKAIKLGAYDYLVKPSEPEQLLNICRRALEKKELLNKTQVLQAQIEQFTLGKMIGKSKGMQGVFKKINKVTDLDVSVLITGETGTGKELVAQALHSEGQRKNKPFIAINCGGIPAELLETELFGHEKGSFTSAETLKIGKFELANGGTIFLDEIGNMPKLMQAKMLRVLQEKEIERVGGNGKPIPVDVRIIAATNEDLKKAAQEGKFRDDLLHRLNVIPLEIPPLRERPEDIPLLANAFLEKYTKRYNSTFVTFGEDTLGYFLSYSWPGNIREMEHLIQRIVTLEEGNEVLPKHLTLEILSVQPKQATPNKGALADIVSAYEKQLIATALEDNNNNVQKVADNFVMHRSTLASKILNYGIKIEKNKND